MSRKDDLSQYEEVVTAFHEAGHAFAAHVLGLRVEYVEVGIGYSNLHPGVSTGRSPLLALTQEERIAQSGALGNATEDWFLQQGHRWLYHRLIHVLAGPVAESIYTENPVRLTGTDAQVAQGYADTMVRKTQVFQQFEIQVRAESLVRLTIDRVDRYLRREWSAISTLASVVMYYRRLQGMEVHSILEENGYSSRQWLPQPPDLTRAARLRPHRGPR